MGLTHGWARTAARPGIGSGKVKRRFVETSRPRLTLAQARKRQSMTASDLAEKAGVAVSTITRIESGKPAKPGSRPIRFDTIQSIADALGVQKEDIAWPGDPLGLGEG